MIHERLGSSRLVTVGIGASPNGHFMTRVLAVASGRTMAFGPGHVPGTAPPGAHGHTVLTGHHDTAFRFLGALAAGDELRVLAPGGGERRDVVVDAVVVDARDTWVLHETADDRVTLVTCYPFDALVPRTHG